MNDREQRFVNWLIKLEEQPNGRAVLAELRRGLGQPPGLAPTVGRYVQPFLTTEDGEKREAAYYLIASLFGLHPVSTANGNMGQHFARLWTDEKEPPDNIARRFNILLSADWDTLPDYLRQAVGLLKSNATPVPVNWAQLLNDVLGWEHPDGKVQLRWSRAFWRKTRSDANIQTENKS
jgi:CRISPR type I-E-associated protein CasB/Cse2